MTKKNSTKKALITSALCLLLCVSMLVGATFAWFTDSVSSAKNTIVAGNLDVELEWSTDGNTWAPVAGAADIFDPEALWEPGRVEVVYLKVSNLGTLALKYQLGVNVYNEIAGTNVAGESFKLSDYLVFTTIEMPDGLTTINGRDAAKAAAGTNKGLKDYNGKTTALEVDGVDYVALIVYMPESVGNEANYKTGTVAPSIELGVNLYATQQMAEEDSFGDDYDSNAAWLGDVDTSWYNADATEFVIGSAEQLAGLAQLVNNGTDSFAGKTVKLGSDIDLNNINWTPIGSFDYDRGAQKYANYVVFKGNFDGQGHTIHNLMINAPTTEGAALFASAESGTIENLTVNNVNIVAGSHAAAILGRGGSAYGKTNTINNCHVTGNINIVIDWAYAGAIVAKANTLSISNCTVTPNGVGVITATNRNAVGSVIGWVEQPSTMTNCKAINMKLTGWANIGSISGFLSSGTTMTGCYAENIVMTKTRADGHPTIGLFAGGFDYSASKAITIKDSTVKNITLNGTHIAAPASANILYGAEFSGNANSNIVLENNTTEIITNNLVEVTKASDAASLDAALKSGEDVVLGGNLKFNASETTANSGYGATGVTVNGTTLDGNGYSLGINNWGTWDAAVHTNGGTIKNLTINSGMRGIFMGSATADVYIDNVTIDGTIYTFNSDGGNKEYGVYISNSTLNGWTSHSDVHKEVVYTNCNFGEGQGYAFCRPYGPTQFVGCDFAAGFKVDAVGVITFENCTINGEPLTAENLSTLVIGGIANATVIG